MSCSNLASADEFVEGWLVAQVLGEGAYGEVRLLVHARTGAGVALKAVRAEGAGCEGGAGGAREAALHRALRHRHVLRCLGERAHPPLHYMFLEYAQGGELFDRIEPDAGMPERDARRFWRQLLSGLQYLHERGVAHRDIKPENLLLDHCDDLKISDFGMATLFRHGSRERLLSRVCGTVPYAAPEVVLAAQRAYCGAPADVWAAGVVLVAMLAGELPWERADEGDGRFVAWCRGGTELRSPWRKLSVSALGVLRRVLAPDARARASLAQLARHPWLEGEASAAPHESAGGEDRACASQPLGPHEELSTRLMDELLSCSQPSGDDETAASQHQSQQRSPRAALLRQLVRRNTRLWLRCGEREAMAALQEALAHLGYAWRLLHPTTVSVECGGVRMRAWVVRVRPSGDGEGGDGQEGEARTLVEVRRSRGCGLEFKRQFAALRDALRSLAAVAPPEHALPDLLLDPAHQF